MTREEKEIRKETMISCYNKGFLSEEELICALKKIESYDEPESDVMGWIELKDSQYHIAYNPETKDYKVYVKKPWRSTDEYRIQDVTACVMNPVTRDLIWNLLGLIENRTHIETDCKDDIPCYTLT